LDVKACKSDPVVSGSLQPNLISPALRFVFQAKIIGFYVSKLHQSLLYGPGWDEKLRVGEVSKRGWWHLV
jgi:hypothetical protein